MRNAFAEEITALAAADERVVLLSGDIGNRLFDGFKARQPERFFNCGIAEANMVSLAAGLAMCGLRPVLYTITPFLTTRCLEQIRVDLCYHRLPVTLVGVGGGLSYANLGVTHEACEDIAFLRVLPEMTVLCPGDSWEVRAALRATLQQAGPVYIRLGKKGEPDVHPALPDFIIGKAIIVRPGQDVCLISTGTTLPLAVAAADELIHAGIAAQVVSFPTVKPLDRALLATVFATFRVVLTIEEHSILGGLGGSVAEWLADQPPPQARLYRLGTPDHYLHEAGEQEYVRTRFGLTANGIAAQARAGLAAAPSHALVSS